MLLSSFVRLFCYSFFIVVVCCRRSSSSVVAFVLSGGLRCGHRCDAFIDGGYHDAEQRSLLKECLLYAAFHANALRWRSTVLFAVDDAHSVRGLGARCEAVCSSHFGDAMKNCGGWFTDIF